MTPQEEFKQVLWLEAQDYEIFQLYGEGLTVKEIGERMKLTRSTIWTYTCRIFETFDIHDYRKLIVFACRYNCSGLKRQPIVTSGPPYKFLK